MKRIVAIVLTLVVAVTFMPLVDMSYAAAKKPAKVSSLKAKASGKTITLTWKKAKNAKQYQVYILKGKKWKKVKALKKVKYSYKGGYSTIYKFKVRGINGKKKGKFSKVVTVKTPAKETPKNEWDGEPTCPEFYIDNYSDLIKTPPATFLYKWEGTHPGTKIVQDEVDKCAKEAVKNYCDPVYRFGDLAYLYPEPLTCTTDRDNVSAVIIWMNYIPYSTNHTNTSRVDYFFKAPKGYEKCEKVGVCGVKASAAAAMCRSLGVPAAYASSDKSNHAIIAFFTGGRWYWADPTAGTVGNAIDNSWDDGINGCNDWVIHPFVSESYIGVDL